VPFHPTVIRRRGVMDRDASPSVPKTWCPRGQCARFRCPSQAGFGQVWCFVRVRRSDAIGVSRRRRRNAGACVRGCRIGFRRVADASNRGLRAACCRCRFGQLAGGGKWALSLNISPQSIPQQAAGITAAAVITAKSFLTRREHIPEPPVPQDMASFLHTTGGDSETRLTNAGTQITIQP
jgi:hypothetical protein